MVSVQRISCSVTLQKLNAAGTPISQEEIKMACIDLCRDEFGVMVINVIDSKNDRSVPHPVADPNQIRIFQRFVADGKLSIQIANSNQMILLKNAPTDQLKTFIKALICKAKIKGNKGKPPSQSERLFSIKAKTLVDISPLQLQEMKSGAYISPNSRVLKQPTKTQLQTPSIGLREKEKGPLKRSIFTPEETNENKARVKLPRVESDSCLQTPRAKSLVRNNSERSLLPTGRKPLSMPPPETKISLFTLGDEQQRVLSAIMSGVNVFLTGCAGTGKSFLLKRIIGMLSPDETFVTASTGVAASQIGGITLHSFAGIGSGHGDLNQELKMAQRPSVANQWRRCKHLIIDEISMVDASFFTKLDQIAKHIRQNERPFGGIQVICSGDFFQLPPVEGRESDDSNLVNQDKANRISLQKRFAFQSPAWDACFGDASRNVMLLRTVYRQSDAEFVRLLRLIRLGKCTEEVSKVLRQSQHNKMDVSLPGNHGISATKLCTHNADAEFINGKQLDSLPSDAKVFNACDNDPTLAQFLSRSCHVPNVLRLKVGAQVMLAKNLNVQEGLVNGARGVVLGFDRALEDAPIVKLKTGKTVTLQPERFIMRCADQLFVRRQVPLRLAWAFSIHRSQGMSLDCVEISLARVFEAGQAYVALSRARSLEGLRVLDFLPTSIAADQEVLNFYKRLTKDLGIRLTD